MIKIGKDWPFSAKENLDRIRNSNNWAREIDPDMLKLAEAALKRMNARKNEDPGEWAERLADDLSKFKD